jgi:hypothetical protein
MTCPTQHLRDRATIISLRGETSHERRLNAEPKLSDIARVFGMGMFWFASLASVVIAIGSLG